MKELPSGQHPSIDEVTCDIESLRAAHKRMETIIIYLYIYIIIFMYYSMRLVISKFIKLINICTILILLYFMYLIQPDIISFVDI
jgi:hypothetical protein